jgi:protein-tyrosine kinase
VEVERLRRALEKAKGGRALVENQLEPGNLGAPPGSRESEVEWRAPVYSKSRHVSLDPKRLAAGRCVCADPSAPEAEPYKVLRAQILQRARQQGWNSFMITSALSGEGKTTTAVNLALIFAMEFNQTTLLVDCDLRRQDVHRLMGYESPAGLTDHLLETRPLQEIIVWPGVEKLSIISGGRTVAQSAELLGSPRMKSLVSEMKGRYPDRVILFDAPSLLEGADAIVLAQLVDAVLVVIRAGFTPLPELRRAVELIPGNKLLGLVMNRCDGLHMGHGFTPRR